MQQTGIARKHTDWIVVANEATAIFYAREQKRRPLKELLTFHNDAARVKTADLISDRGGRSFDSHGQGRHAMAGEKSGPKRHAAEVFAKDITSRLEKALREDHCRGFALIAAPRFLGMLRKELAACGLPKPFMSIDKDVAGSDSKTIEKLLS